MVDMYNLVNIRFFYYYKEKERKRKTYKGKYVRLYYVLTRWQNMERKMTTRPTLLQNHFATRDHLYETDSTKKDNFESSQIEDIFGKGKIMLVSIRSFFSTTNSCSAHS